MGEVRTMKTIDELWYGNVAPFEQCTRGDKRLKELLSLVARNREELGGTLTDKHKKKSSKSSRRTRAKCMAFASEMHSRTASGLECN